MLLSTLASSAQPFAYPVSRMAKTFDNISEASATNYLFLFAQRTLALQNEAPTPPPLNALGLPCEAMCLLWGWHPKKKVHAEKAPELEDAATKKKALDKERSAVNSEEAAKKIAPLVEKIAEYILDHQDDAAQEDRWRTTMKRDMAKSFRVQREATLKVEAGVQKVETEMQLRFEEVHSKMDETLKLVKNIAERSSSASTRQALPPLEA